MTLKCGLSRKGRAYPDSYSYSDLPWSKEMEYVQNLKDMLKGYDQLPTEIKKYIPQMQYVLFMIFLN